VLRCPAVLDREHHGGELGGEATRSGTWAGLVVAASMEMLNNVLSFLWGSTG
jgi:hypothetical protein